MATRIERGFTKAYDKAKQYVDSNRHYLSHEYCMSSSQLSMVEEAYIKGFRDGLMFK